MTDHTHHEELLLELSEQLRPVLDGSNQAIYAYLDDTHKVCNQNFADLLGYASPAEWAAVTTSFPEVFVAQESRMTLIEAFQKAMQHKAASTTPITWLKKDGSTTNTEVILVPISFQGHLVALHFVTGK